MLGTTQPVFDSPQWKLLPDLYGHRMYANVSNLMEVHTGAGTWHVALAVPAGLFPLMKQVFNVGPGVPVNLSLDEYMVLRSDGHEVPRYVFSLMAGDDALYDLWHYSGATAPRWVFNPDHHVRG